MTRPSQGFSILIPAYQAEATLPLVLQRIADEVWQRVTTVWIVDDASRDGTAEQIRTHARQQPKIEGVFLPRNLGYGGACKQALRRIRAQPVEHAVCVHADGQYAPEELPRLLSTLAGRDLDVLQGSRLASGTALSGGMPIYKYLAGRALTAIGNTVLGLQMTDYHSGYMVYGRRALDLVPFDRLSNSFDFDLEVIAAARALGLSIGEAPIPTRYSDEVSHLRVIPYGLRVLRVHWRYAGGYYRRMLQQPPGGASV
ncbi:MAG: glycosyltransferase family 2 protein [Pseudomonadota bacterium]